MNRTPILLVGHCCHDTLFFSDGSKSETLGGSVSYISSLLSDLDVEHLITSKVGSDFSYFSKLQKIPQLIQHARTTHFIADFTQGERIGKVGAICEPIFPEDLPKQREFDLALAVGIVGEVLPSTLESLAQSSRHLLCDAQGLIRSISPNGNVKLIPLKETPFFGLLDKISFLKASRQEAEFIDLEDAKNKTCILITEGKDGCTVYHKNTKFRVPAFATQEVDPTGAGDCFLAGFAMGLLQDLSLEKAILLGNYLGSHAVRQIGIPKVKSADLVAGLT